MNRCELPANFESKVVSVDWSALTPALSPRRGGAKTAAMKGNGLCREITRFRRGALGIQLQRIQRAPSPGGEGRGEGGRSVPISTFPYNPPTSPITPTLP